MSKQCHETVLALITSSFAIKSVKLDFGHDRRGAMGNIFFEGKKAFEFHDDGWGGESEINFFTPELETAVHAFAKKANIAQVMFDNGWNFYDSVAEIDTHTVMVEVAEALIYGFSLEKEHKKIQRKTKSKIVFGDHLSYREISWTGVKDLADLLQHKSGRSSIQKAYNEAKAELAKGERIFNTKEQLTALGITL